MRKGWLPPLAGIAGMLILGWFFLPKPPLLEGISFSQLVLDRNQNPLRITLTADEKYRIYTPLDQISPDLRRATLQQEDRFYENHLGINPVATLRAGWNLIFSNHLHAGASTITMQVARLRFHLHTRTIPGKLHQMLLALELERHYTKDQILEAYFNLAPYGGNIEGAGAATRIYFGISPSNLTLPEAVALSVIPQSPSRRALRFHAANEALTAAQNRLFDKLGADDTMKSYRAQNEVGVPFEAPHFTTQILAEHPDTPKIVTTLDLNLQHLLEKQLGDYVASKHLDGIHNAAAMLIDFHSMDILAKVGSANFFDRSILGEVDGTRCRRSPGSTLKPFVYALAMEQGLIHPLSILEDAPQSFGAYNPENYDREFVGPISAEDALVRSRNIPAVYLASRLHNPTLYEFLKSADVRLTRDESYYGLTLPLGGAEVTMQELVRLYALLGNNGQLRSLQNILPHSSEKGVRLLSPEACFLTLEMLGKNPSPSDTDTDPEMPVFWKTGTSNGFHDAWSIAVFDHYVLAVWVGNFNGQGNPSLVGHTTAAPLLFRMIQAMRGEGFVQRGLHQPPPFANLRQVEFCAVSGGLATPNCRHRVKGWFIPGVSPITSCDIHREVLIDDKTGLRVSVDDGTRKLRREVYEFWPTNLLELFDKAGLPRQLPPPFLPGCDINQSARSGSTPSITSPERGVIYTMHAEEEANNSLVLHARANADAREIYWFVDKQLLGHTAASGSLAWKMTSGHHTILALDNLGRSDSVTIIVESLGMR